MFIIESILHHKAGLVGRKMVQMQEQKAIIYKWKPIKLEFYPKIQVYLQRYQQLLKRNDTKIKKVEKLRLPLLQFFCLL